MDILNWLYLAKNKFVRTAVSSTKDLMIFGAKVGTSKRGDLYQNYTVPISGIVPLVYNTGTVTQLTSLGTEVTLNTYSGVVKTFYDVTNFIPAGSAVSFRVYNSNVTTASIIHVTLQDGLQIGELLFATLGRVYNGFFDIVLNNASLNDTNGFVNVHFSVINVTI